MKLIFLATLNFARLNSAFKERSVISWKCSGLLKNFGLLFGVERYNLPLGLSELRTSNKQ